MDSESRKSKAESAVSEGVCRETLGITRLSDDMVSLEISKDVSRIVINGNTLIKAVRDCMDTYYHVEFREDWHKGESK